MKKKHKECLKQSEFVQLETTEIVFKTQKMKVRSCYDYIYIYLDLGTIAATLS